MARRKMSAAQRAKIGAAVRKAIAAKKVAQKGQQWTTTRKGKPARVVPATPPVSPRERLDEFVDELTSLRDEAQERADAFDEAISALESIEL